MPSLSMIRRIWSDGTEDFLRPATVRGRPVLRCAFEALPEVEILGACVRSAPEGEARRHPCRRRDRKGLQRWEATLPLEAPVQGCRFEILTPEGLLYLNARGCSRVEPFDREDFVHLAERLPVSWIPGCTFYQIFPDRFARGGSEAAWARHEARVFRGDARPLRRPWGAEPLPHAKAGNLDYYGGDLAGILEKLPHLLRLGVSAVYLNPIFRAGSNHRYDVEDYRSLDPLLGTEEDLVRLVEALHEHGCRIIFDGVFNHCSDTHPWFDREGRGGDGAWGNPASPHRERFFFPDGSAHHAHCWNGVESLVKLDLSSETLREELFAGEDAICRAWLDDPVRGDGWRFDVANMMGRRGEQQIHGELWRTLRRAVKERHPDAYLLGEHFFDPGELLDGTRLDGVMNYRGFLFPLLRWLTRRESSTRHWRGREEPIAFGAELLARSWMEALAVLPHGVALGQMNLLGSHDTARIRTVLGGRRLLPLAFALLMTWPGTPCVYYGDEVGMEGGDDPANRRCMDWDEETWDGELLDWIRRLVRLRRDEPFASGAADLLHARGDLLVFLRRKGGERALVAANRGGRRRRIRLDLGVHRRGRGRFQCLAGHGSMPPTLPVGGDGRFELVLPGAGVSIWRFEKDGRG